MEGRCSLWSRGWRMTMRVPPCSAIFKRTGNFYDDFQLSSMYLYFTTGQWAVHRTDSISWNLYCNQFKKNTEILSCFTPHHNHVDPPYDRPYKLLSVSSYKDGNASPSRHFVAVCISQVSGQLTSRHLRPSRLPDSPRIQSSLHGQLHTHVSADVCTMYKGVRRPSASQDPFDFAPSTPFHSALMTAIRTECAAA